MKNWTRKDFLKASLVGGAALGIGRSPARASAIRPRGSANGDIRVAVVGMNGKGNGDVRGYPDMPGVRLVALCDADADVLALREKQVAERGLKVKTYTDYRDLLEDPGIDALTIATPNHWHSLMAVWACQAGKDVYVEKPVSNTVWEGGKIGEAARKYRRIVQAGLQNRSAEELHRAVAYIREGNLGRILWARGLCYKPRQHIGRSSGPQPVPPSVNYDLWSGPAPLQPPRRNTPKNGTVHYDWHWFWNYGGGDLANQGIHQLDICRWFLGQDGLPPAVYSLGGRFAYDDDAETPNTQITFFDYKPAPLIFEVRGLPMRTGMRTMDAYRGTRVGVVIQCEHGYFSAGSSGGGFMYDNDGNRIAEFTGSGGGGHRLNFIEAVRSRRESDLACPVDVGHISSALCHVANISYRLGETRPNDDVRTAIPDELMGETFGRMVDHLQANDVDTGKTPTIFGPRLEMSPGTESFVSRENYDMGYWANTMLKSAYREPFVVPEKV